METNGSGEMRPTIEQADMVVTSGGEKFDMKHLLKALEACLIKEETLVLDSYIEAYEELLGLFGSLGMVFGFIASDVKAKLGILKGHRTSEIGGEYSSIQSMVEYEKKIDKLETSDYSSGSRNLLRLHRALNFTIQFLKSLQSIEGDGKTSALAQAAYKETLAKFHPWLIQKAAIAAMYTLPTREKLVANSCKHSLEEVMEILPSVVSKMQEVYDQTQGVYERNNLLNLK